MTTADFARCSGADLRAYIAANGLPHEGSLSRCELIVKVMRNPDVDALTCLIEHGVDMNEKHSNGYPLWWRIICENANPAVLRKALASGAAISSFDVPAVSPLHDAVRHATPEFCSILLEAGANVHALDHDDFQVIHIAAAQNDAEMVKVLLDRGANAAAKTRHKQTPVHWWASSYVTANIDVLKMLLRAGGDVNAVDGDGYNAAHIAVSGLNPSQLAALIESGVDLEREDARGVRPWQHCWSGSVVKDKVIAIMALIYMSGVSVTYPPQLEPARGPNAHYQQLWRDTVYAAPIYQRLWHEIAHGHVRPTDDDASPDAATLQLFHKRCSKIVKKNTEKIMTICMALQNLVLPSLLLCEIIQAVLWFWPRIRFCDIWNRVVVVRHFHERKQKRMNCAL